MDIAQRPRHGPSMRHSPPPTNHAATSQAPPRLAPRRQRRLWSPLPRFKMPPNSSNAPSTRPSSPKSSLSLAARRSPQQPLRLRSVIAEPSPLRSCSPGIQRSHHSLRPPLPHQSPDAVEDLGSVQHPWTTGTPRQRRPPPTCHGSLLCCSIASTIMSSARKRAQPRPPTPEDVERINRRLSKLSVA